MKKFNGFYAIIIFVLFTVIEIHSQNIKNTPGTAGEFRVRDGATIFLKIKQANGSFVIPSSGENSLMRAIYKGSGRFLHTYRATGANRMNTFLGLSSGNFCLGGVYGGQMSNNTGMVYYSSSSLSIGSGITILKRENRNTFVTLEKK